MQHSRQLVSALRKPTTGVVDEFRSGLLEACSGRSGNVGQASKPRPVPDFPPPVSVPLAAKMPNRSRSGVFKRVEMADAFALRVIELPLRVKEGAEAWL